MTSDTTKFRNKKRLLYGVGVNDSVETVTGSVQVRTESGCKQKRIRTCPFHAVWSSMLDRCYSKPLRKVNPTYEGCTVCDDWLLFSTFKSWMEKQDWKDKQLDKDLIVPNNMLYSDKTCIFVSQEVNLFIAGDKKFIEGQMPRGVCWSKCAGKYMARCSSKGDSNRYLGLFTSKKEAHNAWLTEKLKLARILASKQDNPLVARALIDRYENYYQYFGEVFDD